MGTRGGSGQEIMRKLAEKSREPGKETSREELVKAVEANAKRSSSSKERK